MSWFKEKKQLSAKEEILALYVQSDAQKLDQICQRNLGAVVEIVFDNLIKEEARERILFHYSTPINSTDISAHPKPWINMIVKSIVPRINELPMGIKQGLEWRLNLWQKKRGKSIPEYMK